MNLLPFEKDIVLENDLVLLRPLTFDDFQYLLPFALEEPTLWQFSLLDAGGRDNMQKYIENALEKRANNDSYAFIVFDKVKQKYAGSTRFYDYQSKHNSVLLGYTWYGKEFQRTHVNRNCKYLLFEYAFEKLGIERVELRADNNNIASIAAMKSIGCTFEGILRSNCASHKNGRRDSIILSILKDEWFAEKKELLQSKL